MRSFIPGPVKAILSLLFFTANTCVLVGPLILVSLSKLVVPFKFWQYISRRIIDFIATCWVSFNNFSMWLLQDIHISHEGLDALEKNKWYIVVANHQSWVDILILQKLLLKRIAFLKFFLKQELIWVPLMGLAWWALDFPFMKRYSSSFLEKNPHLRGKDIEITRKACEKFKTIPVSIVNFMEGTRFTTKKHQHQQSPFSHLLRPKAGGIAFILGAMGPMMTGIVNVTIVYPKGPKTFWQYLCGHVREVKVTVELIPITPDLLGDYFEDETFKAHFQTWVNDLWEAKDKHIHEILSAKTDGHE